MGANDNVNCGWRAWFDFAQKVRETPDATAIQVAGQQWTYREFNVVVTGLARAINAAETDNSKPVTAIYADRSLESYAGVLAALMLGHAYVPLNPKFPDSRNHLILQQSNASFVICAPKARDLVSACIDDLPVRVVSQGGDEAALMPRHDSDCAYILFTSGSTGQPKGVPISHQNVNAYLTAASAVTDFGPDDRFSQNFDLTFDLSVHDLFLCWRAGGALIVPSEADLDRPADYVQRDGITCWFSVPSLAQKMNLQGSLEPDALQGIRHSLFCGEALPLDLAIKWRAATGSVVENWYGPTEATIACMRYLLPDNAETLETHLGLTPIGDSLPGMRVLVLDDAFEDVPVGGIGELYLAGPQVTTGYLNDPEKTATSFLALPGRDGRYYRTGDRVKKSALNELHFVDRTDNQIKIRGYRVEIGEIEAVIRDLAGGCTTIVTALPLKSPTPTVLVASVEGWQGDVDAMLAKVKTALPAYMVPTAIRLVDGFPKNTSDKVDRGQIGKSVEAEAESGGTGPRGGVRKQLIELARRINPALTRKRILEAPDLMEAGLDSMAFTEFTLHIEELFGLDLDQNQVADMAEMRLPRLANFIKRRAGLVDVGAQSGKEPGGAKQKKNGNRKTSDAAVNKTEVDKKSVHYKSRRTVECIHKFPEFVEEAKHPIALFFGSSGVVSGIDTKFVETRAAQAGHPISAANLGMAKLSNLGTTELIEYARDVIARSGKNVAFAVYELDVMQLSSLPTGREIEVVKAYLSGAYKMDSSGKFDPWNKWLPKRGGTVSWGQAPSVSESAALVKEAKWSLKREKEVVATYMGEVDFNPMETEIWLAGAKTLKTMTANVQAFVHPINNAEANRVRAQGRDDKFGRLVTILADRSKVRFALSSDFDLEPVDFRDFNHTNLFSGREKISLQLTDMILSNQDT